jgi:hypothetical protein
VNHQFTVLGEHEENDFKQLAVATWAVTRTFGGSASGSMSTMTRE